MPVFFLLLANGLEWYKFSKNPRTKIIMSIYPAKTQADQRDCPQALAENQTKNKN